MKKKLIIFTDLDGTLLDHNNYSWEEARPALDLLRSSGYPLIFSTSKTFAELASLRKALHNRHPMICENGGVVAVPYGYFSGELDKHERFEFKYFGQPYKKITGIMSDLRRKQGFRFQGFADMSVDDVVHYTSLDEQAAANAKNREATEPFLWLDKVGVLDQFQKQLNEHNLSITSGGRFYHVMSPVDKGKAVRWLLDQFYEHFRDTDWVSVALGDSHNDVPMLLQVDHPVLIYNPHSTPPDTSSISGLTRSKLPGPGGWNKCVTALYEKYN